MLNLFENLFEIQEYFQISFKPANEDDAVTITTFGGVMQVVVEEIR